MSKNDMVMVPREPSDEILRAMQMRGLNVSADGYGCLGGLYEDAARLVYAEIVRLARPTEQHHAEPVALPARKRDSNEESDVLTDCANEGWNAFLDEIAKLGPLYPHADPGEVERLRGIIRMHEKTVQEQAEQLAHMRAQLAERDALLREVLVGLWPSTPLAIKINAALSASAEPSAPAAKCTNEDSWNCKYCRNTESCEALKDPRNFGEPSTPVEIDERQEFESAWSARIERLRIRERGNEFYRVQPNDLYRWNNVQDAWELWQARAALARKP